GDLWRPVRVDLDKVKTIGDYDNEHLETHSGLRAITACAALCGQHTWCELWCQQEDGACILRDLFISPAYEEESDSNVQTCFTKRATDYSTDAVQIYGSTHMGTRPKSVKENLLDGLQSLDSGDGCYVSETTSNAFVMFDLGMEKLVNEVHVFPGSTYAAENYFGPLEIRIGQSLVVNNDFNSYKLLGKYSNSTQSRQEVVITPSKPVTGRYLSVQQMRNGYFFICHIEIL
ncbi:unnamed protein product, partial [Meganyctiphanes norvegica]